MFVMGEFGYFLDFGSSIGESGEYSENISSLLHRDNSQLILFINPNEESLLIVMEDTSSFRPVSIQTTCTEESISLFEEEVVIDQLGLIFFRHCLKGVVLASKFTSEFGENS